MIIAIIGDVGSGKSLTMVRNITMHSHKFTFTNFYTKHLKNTIRLKKDDIIIEEGKKCRVNWDFWENAAKKFKKFDIYIDEIHNLFPHRRGMSNYSVEGMKWIAQIRKILGQSEDSHIFLCSQNINHIDIAWRRLLHCIIYCEKQKTKDGRIRIILYTFLSKKSISAEDRFLSFLNGYKTWNFPKRFFIGDHYFKYYESYKLVRGDDGWL